MRKNNKKVLKMIRQSDRLDYNQIRREKKFNYPIML